MLENKAVVSIKVDIKRLSPPYPPFLFSHFSIFITLFKDGLVETYLVHGGKSQVMFQVFLMNGADIRLFNSLIIVLVRERNLLVSIISNIHICICKRREAKVRRCKLQSTFRFFSLLPVASFRKY